jgi:hypothetical protein
MGKPRSRYPPAEPVDPETGIIAVSRGVGLVKFKDERVVSSKDPGQMRGWRNRIHGDGSDVSAPQSILTG